MSWIQRYQVRNYARNSIWILSVLGMVAGLVSVRCLLWIEQRAGWQSDFDPDGARALLQRSTGRFFQDPEDQALADISDVQGVGGNRSGARALSQDPKPTPAGSKAG
jgi:hypothetical protein